MSEGIEIDNKNVRVDLRGGGGYYTYSKKEATKNPGKMERPRPWPDPPPIKKLPELSIGCPVCNDKERRMTILIMYDELTPPKDWRKIIKCDKCGAIFDLVHCNIRTV